MVAWLSTRDPQSTHGVPIAFLKGNPGLKGPVSLALVGCGSLLLVDLRDTGVSNAVRRTATPSPPCWHCTFALAHAPLCYIFSICCSCRQCFRD